MVPNGMPFCLHPHFSMSDSQQCPSGSDPFEEAEERAGKTCVDARRNALRRVGGLFELRNVLKSLDDATPELRDALNYKSSPASRTGWLPSLTQSLYAQTATRGRNNKHSGNLRPLACAQARYEDVAVLRSFFSDADGAPLHAPNATFLEMGGFNGLVESQTWLFEHCFGWRGILIEASPDEFDRLLRNRPASLNLRLAGCSTEGTVLMTRNANHASSNHAADSVASLAGVQRVVNASCGPVGPRLARLGVHRVDFCSLDVEGAEVTVLLTLGLGTHLAVGVLMVEVRGDGQRGTIMRLLLDRGFVYVGALHGRPSPANEVISDVYANTTHLRAFFPKSRALL